MDNSSDFQPRTPVKCGNRRSQVLSGGRQPEPPVECGDWRSQVLAGGRQGIVNRIMDTLKRHFPFSGPEGLQELRTVAMRFEEKIYIEATSQSDYLRKISLKMLMMDQNRLPNTLPSNSTTASKNPEDPVQMKFTMHNNNRRPAQPEPPVEGGDWHNQLLPDARQRVVNKILDTLKRHLPFSELEELRRIAMSFEERMYTEATSQADYLRKISLKMLILDSKSQNSIPHTLPSDSTSVS